MIDHERYRLGRGQAGRALRRVVTRVVCLLMLEVATRLTPVLGRFDLWPKR